VARIAGALGLGLVALAAVAVGSLWIVLESRAGGEWARRLVLPRVNAQLAGRLEVAELRFGGDRLMLRGVTLHDPEGFVVARIARIELAFSPLWLLRRHLALSELRIEEPTVLLAQDRRGLNLTRALAARNPAPETAPTAAPQDGGTGGGLVIDLGQLVVRRALVDFRSNIPDDAHHVRVVDLTVDGQVHLDAGRNVLAIDLRIGGRAEAPVRPLAMAVRLDLHKTGQRVEFASDIAAGHARIDARGEIDLSRLRTGTAGIAVHGSDIDLGELWSDAPRSGLEFDLAVHGGGRDLASLDGSLDFSLPPGRLDGHAMGPVQLSARAVRDECQVASLLATLPGLRITGKGSASRARLDMHLGVEADNLAATAESFSPLHGRPLLRLPPGLAGHGRLDLTVGGTLERPTLQASGGFPQLALGANRISDLTLSARIPNLRQPLGADADLRILTARLGTEVVRDLRVHARAAGPRVTLDVRATSPYPLAVSLGGRWGAARQALAIDSLRITYPEASWSAQRPARLSFPPDRLALEGLDLRSGAQRVRASFSRAKQILRGHVEISRFDLGRLPRLLVPAELKLAGQLNLDARLGGTDRHPEVDAKVVLAKGHLRDYDNLGFDLDARYADGRARGQLDARGLGTALRSRFDLPAAWPPHDRRAPLKIDLTIDETDLPTLQAALAPAAVPGAGPAKPPRLRGRARLSVQLTGTVAEPRLALAADARALVLDGRRVGNFGFTLTGDGDAPLRAQLTIGQSDAAIAAIAAVAGSNQVSIETALSLGSILRRPPDLPVLMRTRFDLRGELDRVPLERLAELGRYPAPVGGTLSLHLAATGTALDPRGTVVLDVAGATSGRFPPTGGHLEAAFDNRRVTASLRVQRKGATLLVAEASLGAAARALADPAALAAAPAHLHAVFGPLALQRLGLPPQTDRDRPRTLYGDVQAELKIDGTLRAPLVGLKADARQIRIDKAPMGTVTLAFDYRDRAAKLDAQLVSANRGSLHLLAATTADLGYPAITAGLSVAKLPLDVHLAAVGFDLEGFSEATPGLRDVGGLLFASADVSGTVADPRFKGRVEVKQGALTITGFGAYKEIHLALHGDNASLALDELFAKSGAGHAEVTAQASHEVGRGYRFGARAQLNKFPIYSDGQALAAVSVDARVKGLAAPLDVSAEVEVREAHVALLDQKRRDLQSLKRPADVVLMSRGAPLNKVQAAKAAALASRLAALTGTPAPGTAARAAPARERAITNTTRLDVRAPRDLWVTGNDVYLELGVAPGFRVESTDKTRVFGQLTVHRGRIDILGRRFDVKSDSSLQFDGPTDKPDLDVTAQYTERTDNINVLLTAKGPIDHLTVTVSSPEHPELNESQLYTMIITGHLQGDGTSGSFTPSGQAASLVGGLVASKLQKTLARRLPLDVLTIDAGDSGINGTQLEAGTYVLDRLYVGYVGRVGADPTRYQNRNAVHLEYQLSTRWSFNGEYGDVGTGTADLIWTKRY
jgi:translocation and assembly module TamB